MPANLPAVAWWPGSDYAGVSSDDGGGPVVTAVSDLRFECAANGGPTRAIALDAESDGSVGRIVPRGPLVPGEVCSLSSKVVTCDLRENTDFLIQWPTPGYDLSFLSGRATFEVGPTAPLPAAIGRVQTKPAEIEYLELSEGASCSGRFEACVVRAELELAEEAQPWRDAFVYETRVDGKTWWIARSAPLPLERGGSYAGRGRDLLYALPPNVHGGNPLKSGRHTIEIRASLPGTSLAFAPEPVEIDLDCDFETRAGDAGAGDAGDASDGMRDSGMVARDSGTSGDGADAGTDTDSHRARNAGTPRLGIKKSSCAVSILTDRADSNPVSGWVLAVLAIGYALRRRKITRQFAR